MSGKTIVEEVYQDLKYKILNFEYKPGEAITEQEISSKYSISRTPCRDVFQKLKMGGLVTSVPFKSNYISFLDLDIIRQSIYMRIAIEHKVIKDTMDKLDDKVIADLDYNLRLQELLLTSDFDPSKFYDLDSKLHKIWFSFTKNDFIWEQIQKSQVHYTRFRMLDIVAVKDFKALYEDHKKLIKVIKSKDYSGLEKIITDHLNSGIRRLEDKIKDEFSEYFINE